MMTMTGIARSGGLRLASSCASAERSGSMLRFRCTIGGITARTVSSARMRIVTVPLAGSGAARATAVAPNSNAVRWKLRRVSTGPSLASLRHDSMPQPIRVDNENSWIASVTRCRNIGAVRIVSVPPVERARICARATSIPRRLGRAIARPNVHCPKLIVGSRARARCRRRKRADARSTQPTNLLIRISCWPTLSICVSWMGVQADGKSMHFRQWKRRDFITLLGRAAAARPLAARAQQPAKAHRLGFLTSGSSPAAAHIACDAASADLGYVEQRDLVVERRYAAGDLGGLPELAADLTRSYVDVVVSESTPAARAAKQATSRSPIVM